MKISIFSAFYPFRGGIAQFSDRLVEELRKKNDVTPFTFRKQYPDFLFPGKTQLVEKLVPEKVSAKSIVSTFNPFTYFKGARLVRQSNPEVFLTNYWMTFFGPFMTFFAIRLNRKVKKIALVHNLVPHEKRFFDRFFNKLFLSRYDAFVVLSEAVKKDILALKPHAQILQLQHPLYDHFGDKIDKADAQRQFGLQPKKKTLLFFGLIREYKGLDNLILAMKLLPDDYQLLIVGEVYGDEHVYCRLIQDSGREKDIVFENKYVSDEEVSTYFSAADLCVLPYRSATQSGITAIAHFLETPVLTTDVGGLRETVEHSKTGYIVATSDPELIAQGIVDFFNTCDPVLIKSEIQAVKKDRSWEKFCQDLEDFMSNEAKY